MVEADVGALRPDDRSWEVQGRRETRSGWRLRVGWATTLFHTKSLRTNFVARILTKCSSRPPAQRLAHPICSRAGGGLTWR